MKKIYLLLLIGISSLLIGCSKDGEDSVVNPVLLFLSGEKENTLVIAAIYNNIDLFGRVKQQIDTKVYNDFDTQTTMDQIINDMTLIKTTLDQMSKLAKAIDKLN